MVKDRIWPPLALGWWESQRQGNSLEGGPRTTPLTFAEILRKRCTDFVAAQQQAWAEGPPIWKPLRSPSSSSPNSLFPENRRRSYPTTSWGFLWGWWPLPCLSGCTSPSPAPQALLSQAPYILRSWFLFRHTYGCTARLPREALQSHISSREPPL